MQAKIAMAQAKAMRPWYKKKRWWLGGLLVIVVIIIIAAVASAGNTLNNLNNKQQKVVYTITGTGKADVTYSTEHGGSLGESQDTNATLPWTKAITMSGAFGDYVLNAQLTGTGTTITCAISVNGKQVTSNTSSGKFASVTCSSST